jgi:hypothetical protein
MAEAKEAKKYTTAELKVLNIRDPTYVILTPEEFNGYVIFDGIVFGKFSSSYYTNY